MDGKIISTLLLFGLGVCWAVGEYGATVRAAENFKIVDGDSLERGAERIRILNIDAPEYTQRCYDANNWKYMCGIKATEHLKTLMSGAVRCERNGEDRYGRSLAVCYRADGTDIGRQMVRNGWAVAYGDAYRRDEEYARQYRKGIWQGKFMRPELFRAMRKSRKSPRK